ncbi:MAG TPA: hypothetical protein VFG72_12245 [Marmoricola sp.]|nr:hypothetical protein [Marmoricola sp.]
MDTSDIVWIVVAVLVLLALAALIAAMMRKKKAAQGRDQAQHLRTEAAAQAGGLQESRIQAQEAELRAERARLEAEKEQARAEEVKQGHLAEEARVEDRVREADRLDPDVDDRDAGYTPTTPEPGTLGTSGRPAAGDTTPGQGEVVRETHEETVYETDPNDPDNGSGSSRVR